MIGVDICQFNVNKTCHMIFRSDFTVLYMGWHNPVNLVSQSWIFCHLWYKLTESALRENANFGFLFLLVLHSYVLSFLLENELSYTTRLQYFDQKTEKWNVRFMQWRMQRDKNKNLYSYFICTFSDHISDFIHNQINTLRRRGFQLFNLLFNDGLKCHVWSEKTNSVNMNWIVFVRLLSNGALQIISI